MERTTEMEQFLLKQRRRKKGDFWRLGVNSGHFKFIFQTAGVRVPKLRYLRRKGGGALTVTYEIHPLNYPGSRRDVTAQRARSAFFFFPS